MFLCLLYAPIHQNKFQVGVNLLGNKYYSDSDSDSEGSKSCDTPKVTAKVTHSSLFILFCQHGSFQLKEPNWGTSG